MQKVAEKTLGIVFEEPTGILLNTGRLGRAGQAERADKQKLEAAAKEVRTG